MKEKIFGLILIVASCLVGFLICEMGYRILLNMDESKRWQPQQQFTVHSGSVWAFDADLGFTYKPSARMDGTFVKDGIPRGCQTFVTNEFGSPGNGANRADYFESKKIIVLGASFTAMVHDNQTWPDILSNLVNDNHANRVGIVNFSRDGYSVMQSFDLAANLVRKGERPLAFIVAIAGPDLIRGRFWRMTFEHGNDVDIFTSIVPSTDVQPETHVRTAFADRRATRAWCDTHLAAQTPDPIGNSLSEKFDEVRRHDEAFFGRRIDLFSVKDCYVCNLVRFGQPLREAKIGGSVNPTHSLTRFQDDPRFAEDIVIIKNAGIPIWLVYLPYYPELRDGRMHLESRDSVLLDSLKSVANRYFDLTPKIPMGDAATALTMLPLDSHPSHAGLVFYARELQRQITPFIKPE